VSRAGILKSSLIRAESSQRQSHIMAMLKVGQQHFVDLREDAMDF
jgi:hypothetical protein